MNTNLALKFEPDYTDEALAFGKGNIFQSIIDDYTKLGLIGEDHNKLMCYLAAVSRKMDTPLNILVLSSSGAGKSVLQDKTIKLLPPEDVIRTSSISNKALFYMDSLKGKLLAIEEAAGMNDTYAIRTLISEGYLSLESVSGGKLKSTRIEGPTTVFMTTTNPEINPETKNRFYVLGIDESKEQTRQILEAQRKAHTLEGLIENRDLQVTIQKHYAFQRMLKPYAVINPFAESIFYEDTRIQARRDQPKFLNLCKLLAFTRQMQKQIHSHENIKYIEVDQFDIDTAINLASEVIGTSLDDLSLPARDLLNQLDEWLPTGKERTKSLFTRRQTMEKTLWGKTRLHTHLKELLDLELVVKESGKQNSLQHYKLLYNGEGKDGRKFLIGIK